MRLSLRTFSAADADAFITLAGDLEVARMTCDIPHPLDRAMAQRWLEPAPGEFRQAIVTDGKLVGGAGYFIRDSGVGELGFWIGRPWWGRGYATAAARDVLAIGFGRDRLPAFSASHFTDNPASGRVLAKLGFVVMGTARQMSVARGAEVATVSCWLERTRYKDMATTSTLA